jgi:hypothetical protein
MLKGELRCEYEYQGYKARKGAYRRSDGLQPEGGFVELFVSDFKKLTFNIPGIQWRAVNGFEFDSGISIRSWEQMRGLATITADRPAAPEPGGDGINLFGDLVMRTFAGDEMVHEVRYSDVYVDLSYDEVIRGLANVKEHKEGVIRVPLTDIRRYYQNYGAFFTRINCRRKNGKRDLDSFRINGEAHPLTHALEMMFTQLPGSPMILKPCDLYEEFFDPPQGVEGEGEPVLGHLEKLLERFGLKAQMQPGGNYLINRKFSTRLKRFHIPTAPGKQASVEEDLHDERFAFVSTDRPAAAAGLGGRRVKRMTALFVPVLRDSDGLWYTLDTICVRWKYSLTALNRQVLALNEKSFDDVLPAKDGSEEDLALHDERRDMLRMAYRHYLPAFLFARNPDGGVDLGDADSEELGFLPMVDCAWYRQEFENQRLAKIMPRPESKGGDLGEIFLMPPIVRGRTIGQTLFRTFKEVEDQFEANDKDLKIQIDDLLKQRNYDRFVAQLAGEFLFASESTAEKTLEHLRERGVAIDKVELDLGGDIKDAGQKVGVVIPMKKHVELSKNTKAARETLLAFGGEQGVGYWDKLIDKAVTAREKLKQRFAEFKKTWEDTTQIPCRYNKPLQTLSLRPDRDTGLITSPRPLCVAKDPFFFTGDSQEVALDGCVTVTFGYEIKGQDIEAFTNYLFRAEDGGDPDKIATTKFCGCHRSTPIKSRVFPIESREYLQENGQPMNLNACLTEAKGKAAAMLNQPRRVPAWVLEVIGLRKAVLDAGATSIQHVWNGAAGLTHVFVNAIGNGGPMGPPNLPPSTNRAMADLREMMQREDFASELR